MTTQDSGDERRRRAIGEIVGLLDRAYQQTCASSQFNPRRIDLGLGIYLVRAQTCHALDPGRPVTESASSEPTSVPGLLRAAELLTRDLLLGSDAPPNVTNLVVALCDLIRDADHVAW